MSLMAYRILTSEEIVIIQRNNRRFEERFNACNVYCANPECKYPLSSNTEHFHILGFGPVCDLCHDMHTIVKNRAFFCTAQSDDERERNRRKRL